MSCRPHIPFVYGKSVFWLTESSALREQRQTLAAHTSRFQLICWAHVWVSNHFCLLRCCTMQCLRRGQHMGSDAALVSGAWGLYKHKPGLRENTIPVDKTAIWGLSTSLVSPFISLLLSLDCLFSNLLQQISDQPFIFWMDRQTGEGSGEVGGCMGSTDTQLDTDSGMEGWTQDREIKDWHKVDLNWCVARVCGMELIVTGMSLKT